ncbi:thiopeptide-type bacteriocin biosynthesis protein [Brevibacillus laterosporus]|uniref:thiopeptide-type bacteriocin biosynthesis protein n=1 Tax=Brevibacillus laterosporus TaxID=1465 RepID=UPI0015966461|nr:thiopeptide-type bacteriocin biosynthesis protein [Brevibacillus laterosporus]
MSKKWIYYSVYPGKEAYLDEVVTKIVGDTFRELTACQSVHRWFFIRYVDFEGYHVRLRFQVDDAAEDLYAEKLESRIHTLMDTILSGSATQIRHYSPQLGNHDELFTFKKPPVYY